MVEEASQLLETGSAAVAMSPEDEQIARLAARGESVETIAASLHLTKRSVYRRLARLRKRVGAQNAAELAGRLSKLGF